MPSFDVISKVNYQEFDNALANCLRESVIDMILKALIFQLKEKTKLSQQ